MQVLSVRVGMTKNLGNYESAKIECEASPDNGQPLEEFLGQVNDFLGKQVEAAVEAAGGVKEKPAKGSNKKSEPPFKADKPAETILDKSSEKAASKPAAKNSKPAPKADKAEQPKANINRPDTKRELQYTLESETLEELRDRLNQCVKMATDFGDKWEDALSKIADRYRKLNSLDADPDILADIVATFKAERQAIENRKEETVAA